MKPRHEETPVITVIYPPHAYYKYGKAVKHYPQNIHAQDGIEKQTVKELPMMIQLFQLNFSSTTGRFVY